MFVNLVIRSDGVSTPSVLLLNYCIAFTFHIKSLVHKRRLKHEIPKLKNRMFSTFRLINFYSNVRCLQNFESEVIEDKERVLCDFSK